MKIKKKADIEFQITPTELANYFLKISAQDQVEFFNAISHKINNWQFPLDFQLEHICRNKALTDDFH